MVANGHFSGRIGRNRAILICFGDRFGWNQTVLTVLAPVSTNIRPNRPESGKKEEEENWHVKRWTPRWDESNAGAAALEPYPCFLAREQGTTSEK